jgi:chromosome partitioning protein
MALKSFKTVHSRVGVGRLATIADRAQNVLVKLCDDSFKRNLKKVAPMFTSSKVARLCDINRVDLNYLCTRGRRDGYPVGTITEESRSRMFTLAEAQAFVRANGRYQPRPTGQKGIICAVGNLHADVSKMTCAVAIAQGLTLKGHKVLLIDLDPHASSTMLLGYIPDVEIGEEMTLMPVINGEQQDLRYACISTYWDELDLIPSCHALVNADLYLSNDQVRSKSFDFWTVLDTALEPLRHQYDIILVDTPSNFSYLTTAAYMAADGLIVPLPPETLDFASSSWFFRKIAELVEQINKKRDIEKNFEFIRVVLSKVNLLDATTAVMRDWIKHTYHELVTTAAIIETNIIKNAGLKFQTLYDIDQFCNNEKSFVLAFEAFDSLIKEIDFAVQNAWQVRITEGAFE